MGDWIPDAEPGWWTKIETFATQIQTYGIGGWFRRRAVRFILGALFGFVLQVAGIVNSAWMTVTETFGGAGETLWNTIGGAVGGVVIMPVESFNAWVFQLLLADTLGGLEAPVLGVMYLVEFAIVLRLAKPLLLTLGEAASGIPVLGGFVTGGITFLVEFQESMTSGVRRAIGGLT